MRDDYYELLDSSPLAAPRELKAAYRRQAMRFHPDRNEGNAAAEERFKLISEAWRVLGDPERRADYDSWLERRNRYQVAPELASFHRHVHVSARRGRSRRIRAEAGDVHISRARQFLVRRSVRTHPLWYALYVLFALSLILPVISRSHSRPREEKNPFAQEESANLPLEVQKEKFQAYSEELRLRAEQGDPLAQLRYGLLLYNGHGTWYGLEKNVPEARRWWRLAAAQGNTLAASMLEHTENPTDSGKDTSPNPVQDEASRR